MCWTSSAQHILKLPAGSRGGNGSRTGGRVVAGADLKMAAIIMACLVRCFAWTLPQLWSEAQIRCGLACAVNLHCMLEQWSAPRMGCLITSDAFQLRALRVWTGMFDVDRQPVLRRSEPLNVASVVHQNPCLCSLCRRCASACSLNDRYRSRAVSYDGEYFLFHCRMWTGTYIWIVLFSMDWEVLVWKAYHGS